MSRKFMQSWELFKASITITFQHRKLLWFPIVTTLLTGVIVFVFFSAIALPIVLHPTGYHLNQKQHWVALKNYYLPQVPAPSNYQPPVDATSALNTIITGRPPVTTDKSGNSPVTNRWPWAPVCWLALYLTSMFLATFFNVAYYNEIIAALNGRGVSLRRGFGVAWSRLQPILAWSLLAGVVGWLIRLLEERLPFGKRIVVGLIGTAWSVAAVFAIPVIIQEETRSNPIKVLQQSAKTLKAAWGEGLIGYLGFSAGNILIFAFSLVPLVIAIVLAVLLKSGWPFAVGVILWIVSLLLMSYVVNVASHVFRCALYLYAAEGTVPAPYTQDLLDKAWTVKPKS